MLSQEHRRTIHEKLSPIIGDEEVDAMLSEYPLHPADAPVTTHRFDERFAEQDRRFEERFHRIDVRFAELEGGLRAEMHAIRAEVHSVGRQMLMWSTTSLIGGMGLAAAIGAAFGG